MVIVCVCVCALPVDPPSPFSHAGGNMLTFESFLSWRPPDKNRHTGKDSELSDEQSGEGARARGHRHGKTTIVSIVSNANEQDTSEENTDQMPTQPHATKRTGTQRNETKRKKPKTNKNTRKTPRRQTNKPQKPRRSSRQNKKNTRQGASHIEKHQICQQRRNTHNRARQNRAEQRRAEQSRADQSRVRPFGLATDASVNPIYRRH